MFTGWSGISLNIGNIGEGIELAREGGHRLRLGIGIAALFPRQSGLPCSINRIPQPTFREIVRYDVP